MPTSMVRWTRKVGSILGAGVLLQAGGCSLDTGELFTGLIASIVNSTIANLVFGSLGLAA